MAQAIKEFSLGHRLPPASIDPAIRVGSRPNSIKPARLATKIGVRTVGALRVFMA
jgi:hypothetical protein